MKKSDWIKGNFKETNVEWCRVCGKSGHSEYFHKRRELETEGVIAETRTYSSNPTVMLSNINSHRYGSLSRAREMAHEEIRNFTL